ncbi:EAL domain-containing protein [Klebsiella sp. R445]
MHNRLISIVAAVTMFVLGAFILNTQFWYAARADSLAGAKYALKNMNMILNEARLATRTAIDIVEKGCGPEEQYRLGTEASLQPHLRTIIILRDETVWCSSLPGNRVLLIHASRLPISPLLLIPSGGTVNGLPILLVQTVFADSRIMVTVSDSHIRDALDIPIKDVRYVLRVGNNVIGMFGDVTAINETQHHPVHMVATEYPFSIEYDAPAFFSLQNLPKMISRSWGVLLFLLLISYLTAYILHKYLNTNTLPEDELQRAIEKGEIVPFYQPIVNGAEGTLRGVEVLARWNHPIKGYISPGSFISLAEKSGLIVPLTQSLMTQVASNMNTIASKLPEGFHVGINYSACHIAVPTFIEECLKYKSSFSRHDLNLIIEVTEREPLNIDKTLIQTLNKLHKKGFYIALDDFGTGYSGLSYLQKLHIDYIKIDQSFVSRVNEHEYSTLILDSVLDLAHKLSISIVAEGVETQEQLEYLSRKKITFMQGYYFFKPVSFAELTKILLSKPKVRVIVE